jgi:peroxiredoxin
MKKYFFQLCIALILTLVSCSGKPDYGPPTVDLNNIEKDFMGWWSYHNKNIVLSSNFIGLDISSNVLCKEDFLKSLISGDFIPLKLRSKEGRTCYKLFKLDQTADKQISGAIKQASTVCYKYFKMEGKDFPKFNFKDLNGVEYSNENTRGKVVVLKCWYTSCVACVAEIPKLNELVDQFQNRKDVVFISLAFNQKGELIQFLSEKPFRYSVVADQKSFMVNELDIKSYPTHIVIGKDGVIQKVVNKADEMIAALKEALQSN